VTVLQSLLLGAVQGLTEFLPVSSDGHLAITYRLLGRMPDLTFEVFLHFATLLAIIVYFRTDLLALLRSLLPAGKGSDQRRLALVIALGTGVSGVLAFALEKVVESANESLIAIGAGFLVTAAALAAAELLSTRASSREPHELGWKRTLAIAVAQAAAALPGVSRSGSTIAAGMLSGLSREQAARFSFLLGAPIIAAANLYKLKDILGATAGGESPLVMAAGFLVAGVLGYAAIAGLLALVRRSPLTPFSVYTGVVGVAVIAWGILAR
jgi:undecaprenyl-diphosphatase